MTAFMACSCPACDFRGGARGLPIDLGGGMMRCASCGTQWRELGASRPAERATPDMRPPMPAAPPRSKAKRMSGRSSGAPLLWICGGLAILLLVLQPLAWHAFPLLPRGLGASADSMPEFASVSGSRLVRDGQVAVRVEGRIVNRGPSRVKIEVLDIVLRDQAGRPLHGWTHKPSIAYLDPGRSIGFATAIADAPATAGQVEIQTAGVTIRTRL